MWNLSTSSTKAQSISPPLHLGCPYDLLWPLKCGRNEDVPNLSLGPKTPWVPLPTLLDSSLLHKNKVGLACSIEEQRESDKRCPNQGHTRPAGPQLNFLLTVSEPSHDQQSPSQGSVATHMATHVANGIVSKRDAYCCSKKWGKGGENTGTVRGITLPEQNKGICSEKYHFSKYYPLRHRIILIPHWNSSVDNEHESWSQRAWVKSSFCHKLAVWHWTSVSQFPHP